MNATLASSHGLSPTKTVSRRVGECMVLLTPLIVSMMKSSRKSCRLVPMSMGFCICMVLMVKCDWLPRLPIAFGRVQFGYRPFSGHVAIK